MIKVLNFLPFRIIVNLHFSYIAHSYSSYPTPQSNPTAKMTESWEVTLVVNGLVRTSVTYLVNWNVCTLSYFKRTFCQNIESNQINNCYVHVLCEYML